MAEVEEHEIVNNSRVSTDDLSFQYAQGGEGSGWSPVRTYFLPSNTTQAQTHLSTKITEPVRL